MTDTNKLNQLCAEKLGWYRLPHDEDAWAPQGWVYGRDSYGKLRSTDKLPQFTSDHNAAITLLDALAKKGWRNKMNQGLDGTWECETQTGFGKADDYHYGAGDTLPLAIVEVFLRAHGIWEEEP